MFTYPHVRNCFKILLLISLTLALPDLQAQGRLEENNSKQKPKLKDTVEGQFDFSYFLIDSKGYMPIPMNIAAPAPGNFGLELIVGHFNTTPDLAKPEYDVLYIVTDFEKGRAKATQLND